MLIFKKTKISKKNELDVEGFRMNSKTVQFNYH